MVNSYVPFSYLAKLNIKSLWLTYTLITWMLYVFVFSHLSYDVYSAPKNQSITSPKPNTKKRPLTETSHQRTINQQSDINSHDISSNQCLPPSWAWLLPSGRSPGPNPLMKLQLHCTRESPGSQLNKSKKEVSEPDPWLFGLSPN